jgi:hypothetical protein
MHSVFNYLVDFAPISQPGDPLWYRIVKGILLVITFPLWLLAGILGGVLSILFHKLPGKFQASITFSTRYTRRWACDKGSAAGVKLRNLTGHVPTRHRNTKRSGQRLAYLLSISLGSHDGSRKGNASSYDILQLIAHELDYVDLVNLSLVSRSVRSVLFPPIEDQQEDRQLRYHSCYGEEKFECWTCAIQVCRRCSGSGYHQDSATSYHMNVCRAQCSKCFQTSLTHKGGFTCLCYKEQKSSNYSFSRRAALPASKSRILCRQCNDLSDQALRVLRERRDEMVYQRLLQQPLACSTCMVVLPPKGVRWWMCSVCNRECRHPCHPTWSRKLLV